MSRTLVWVTRAEPSASATAARVAALGREPLVAPLLELRPLSPNVDLDGVAALAFTSANAVDAFAALTSDRTLAAYAVGRSTAKAASNAGFQVIAAGEGGVEALARLIIARHARARGHILHPGARELAGDLAGALIAAGLKAERLPVYAAETAPALPGPVAKALAAGVIDAVLLHSPRAARVLGALVCGAEFRPTMANVRALALSPACLQPLASLVFKARRAAQQPTDDSLLALL